MMNSNSKSYNTDECSFSIAELISQLVREEMQKEVLKAVKHSVKGNRWEIQQKVGQEVEKAVAAISKS